MDLGMISLLTCKYSRSFGWSSLFRGISESVKASTNSKRPTLRESRASVCLLKAETIVHCLFKGKSTSFSAAILFLECSGVSKCRSMVPLRVWSKVTLQAVQNNLSPSACKVPGGYSLARSMQLIFTAFLDCMIKTIAHYKMHKKCQAASTHTYYSLA